MTWRKLQGDSKTKGAVYEHPYSGWQIHHCGHPTALWPYYLTEPGRPGIVVSHNGRGFRDLDAAKTAVVYLICNMAHVDARNCVIVTAPAKEQTR